MEILKPIIQKIKENDDIYLDSIFGTRLVHHAKGLDLIFGNLNIKIQRDANIIRC